MALGAVELLQINATVLAGLVVLFTVQSLASPSTSSVNEEAYRKLREEQAEWRTLSSLCTKLVTDNYDYRQSFGRQNGTQQVEYLYRTHCANYQQVLWNITYEEHKASNTLPIFAWTYSSPATGQAIGSGVFAILIDQGFYVRLINVVMTVPFVVSSMVALGSIRRGKSGDAPKSSLRLAFIGFGFIIAGLAAMLALTILF